MTSLNALPTEILENIIGNIPGRPFHTELLLLNKTLCHVFMIEQIRKLRLRFSRLNRWIQTITNKDIKKPCSELQYYNFLNKVVNLDILVFQGFSEEEETEETILGFIGCCTNLRILTLRGYPTLQWNANLIFKSLPLSITEMSLTKFTIANRDGGIHSFTHSFAGYAKRNKKLETLNFCEVDIDKEGTSVWEEFLKPSSSIKRLSIEKCEISLEDAYVLTKCLKQNTTLTYLYLERNSKCDEEWTYHLTESLKHNTALTHVNISYNFISDEGVHALAKALKQNTVLTSLELICNFINVKGVRTLAKALEQNIALTYLNISGNEFYAEGAHALAKALKRNATLTNLILRHNFIRAEGAHALAEALKQNTVLTNLNLYGNYIGDKGSHALAESLKQNTALTTLDLSDNSIHAEGAHALAKALKQNTTLTNLNLYRNYIGAEGSYALAEVLKQDTTLTYLNLKWNYIETKDIDILIDSLRQNTTLTVAIS